ncbi:hypothetical protein ALT761_02253 [Alteromonas sp. 76-1]|jgi:hypothetical protein|uniref:hypothetical protein n=1 Tax=Alteromonas sp. 76-1 TaxID=2358187 RepID=UPI000FD15AEE|nr:hypothetical protein [Alteromonas sp. 76-1]VEL97252.1 hypothetical protein ALT761_02253 [Alteromonas sp. 76-1]
MKYLIILAILVFSSQSFAKERLPSNCAHLSEVSKATFVLFNKKEFMQLGECLAIAALKNHKSLDLVRSCNEVDENRRNFLGILSLSKLESILLGQCKGTIDYIYEHYNKERVNDYRYRSSNRIVYRCVKGEKAVDILRSSKKEEIGRSDVRDLLCDEVYN